MDALFTEEFMRDALPFFGSCHFMMHLPGKYGHEDIIGIFDGHVDILVIVFKLHGQITYVGEM